MKLLRKNSAYPLKSRIIGMMNSFYLLENGERYLSSCTVSGAC